MKGGVKSDCSSRDESDKEASRQGLKSNTEWWGDEEQTRSQGQRGRGLTKTKSKLTKKFDDEYRNDDKDYS